MLRKGPSAVNHVSLGVSSAVCVIADSPIHRLTARVLVRVTVTVQKAMTKARW